MASYDDGLYVRDVLRGALHDVRDVPRGVLHDVRDVLRGVLHDVRDAFRVVHDVHGVSLQLRKQRVDDGHDVRDACHGGDHDARGGDHDARDDEDALYKQPASCQC